MRGYIFLLMMLTLILAISCEKNNEDTENKATLVSFQVEFVKPNEGYSSVVKTFSNRKFNSSWRENNDGTVQITREVSFDVLLENGEELAFGYWFMKFDEKKEFLILEDEDLGVSERNWDYIEFEDEKNKFYQNYDESRILVNNNVVFYSNLDDDFKVKDINLIKSEGKEKIFAKIEFQGNARGWYDPQGKSNEYIITNGILTGIME